MQFSNLNLSEPLLRALNAEGYSVATPIQAQAIPHVLEGRDVLGSAQTGTGKTAAFALPILHLLHADKRLAAPGKPNVLVLCPTRELATQIADGFRAYGQFLNIRHTVIFGGVGQNPQAAAIRRGVEVVVATPGRLLDLAQQRLIDLRDIHTLVLDEADRMLDMGFIHDIRRITAMLGKDRQTLLFSATMPNEIRELANSLLKDPVRVNVAPVSSTADNIAQSVYFVEKKNKPHLLAHLYHELPMARAIVFTRTKHGADKVVAKLRNKGIRAEAIHGNKSQNARQRALDNFKSMKTPVLVATDIAARGIDVDGITHVVNYDLTHEPETYVHRIGRTARAGASGAAVSFCDSDERSNLKGIERLLKKSIPVCDEHPEYPNEPYQVSMGTPRLGNEDGEERRPSHQQKHSKPARHQSHEPRREDRSGQRSDNRRSQPGRPAQPMASGRPAHAKHESHAPRHERGGASNHPRPNKFRGKPRTKKRY